jgi:hypothetical protein
MAAVSADGRTVCVLIRRLNSSCSRSIALVVRKRGSPEPVGSQTHVPLAIASSPLEPPDDTRQSTGIDVRADDHAQAIRQHDLNPSLSNNNGGLLVAGSQAMTD